MMNSKTDSDAKTFLKPPQVEDLRSACYRDDTQPVFRQRNDALVQLLYDSGLRIREALALEVDFFDPASSTIVLPGKIQKDYPNDNSPTTKTMELSQETTRTLRSYLSSRDWSNSTYLFPSRESKQMTTQSARDMITALANAADVRPWYADGSRGAPDQITPHTFRHSVAYRLLVVEDGNTLDDVQRRLRHAARRTTEREYSHWDTV